MGLFDRFFGPLTPEKFAKIMADGLRRAGDDRTSTYDKDEFRLLFKRGGKDAGVMNLGNLFKEYSGKTKEERSVWLRKIVPAMVPKMEIPKDFEDVKPDLMPTVRPRAMLETLRLENEINGGKSYHVPHVALTDHLVVCLVYDLPNSMNFVLQDNLNDWGVTIYEAFEVARQNLAERSFTMASVSEKLFIIQSGDAYDGTRLLLTEHIRAMEVNGPPVAMAVTRDCLLIAGADDDVGLTMMLTIAEQQQEKARPLFPVPILLVEDEWKPFRLPPDHPLFDKFRELELKDRFGEYDEQKKLLEKRHQQTGEDVFVASFSPVERDGKLLSYCVWPKTVMTWLPRTDYVGLFGHDADSQDFVRWERLQEVAGSMMEPLDCYPPRWLVSDFPSVEQIAGMQPEDWSKGADNPSAEA